MRSSRSAAIADRSTSPSVPPLTSPRTPWRRPRIRLTWPLAPSPCLRPSMTRASDWLITAVGPPDWPIAALPDSRSDTKSHPCCVVAGTMPGASCAGKLGRALPADASARPVMAGLSPPRETGAKAVRRGRMRCASLDCAHDAPKPHAPQSNLAGAALFGLDGHIRHLAALDPDRRQDPSRTDALDQSFVARRALSIGARL